VKRDKEQRMTRLMTYEDSDFFLKKGEWESRWIVNEKRQKRMHGNKRIGEGSKG
jgi:hypothetical protein